MVRKTLSSSFETPVHTLSSSQIAALIESRFLEGSRVEPQMEEVFRSILLAAKEYVPAESGSICLSNSADELIFIASFGETSHLVPGTRLSASQGITGKVYRTGKPALRNDVSKDRSFFAGIDEKTKFVTRSIMSVPILLDGEVVGVLSLLNRILAAGFRNRDLQLMEIFCRYLSTSMKNLIDFQFVRELSQRDHLSGLRNDRYFYQQLLVEIEGCERYDGDLSLIFFDLDHFKSVVDTYGHLVGSQVLAEVGHLLAATVANPGATLARYGGDEYVIVLPGVETKEAVEVAEKVRTAIAEQTYLTKAMLDGTPALNLKGHFTASVGVACYRGVKGDTVEARSRAFIRMADQAMYTAKAQGKNRVVLACE